MPCSRQDAGGRKVALIKDWKELITKVGDNQCLLQSLKDSPYFPGAWCTW